MRDKHRAGRGVEGGVAGVIARVPRAVPRPEPKGEIDGAWAPHAYGAVHRSTGFGLAEGPLPPLGGRYAALAEAGMEGYERLLRFA